MDRKPTPRSSSSSSSSSSVNSSHPLSGGISDGESSGTSSGKLSKRQVRRHINKLVEDYRRDLERKFGVSEGLMTLDEIEGAALEIRDEVGRAVVQEMTQAEVEAAEAEEESTRPMKRECVRCQRGRAYRGHQERTIVTMAGEVHIKRRVHHCQRCHHCTMPVDEKLSLPIHRFTPRVEQWVARLCVKDTFERAVADLRELSGVWVSSKEAQRICQAIGEHVQALSQAEVSRVFPRHPRSPHLRGRRPEEMAEQLHSPDYTGYVSVDGVMVPMDDGRYVEAKVGHVELVQAVRPAGAGSADRTHVLERAAVRQTARNRSSGHPPHAYGNKANTGAGSERAESARDGKVKQEVRELTSLYSFHLGGPDQCAQQTYVLAARAGITQLSRLVFIADGAEWIWRRAMRYFPGAIQILDWYHAVEHLAAAIKTCVMAELALSPTQADKKMAGEKLNEKELQALYEQLYEQKLETAKSLMWDGEVSKLLSFLKRLPMTLPKQLPGNMANRLLVGRLDNPDVKECVRKTVQYFRKNRKRMRYDEYRERGFRIGSGSMESACKQVVTTRLKGAGMRWSDSGAQAMGHLRALFLSGAPWKEVVGNWPGRGRVAVPSC